MSCAIVTRYLGPTNYRGARIVADAGDRRRVTIGYPYALSGVDAHFAAVKALCAKFDWHGSFVAGDTPTGYAFVFESWRNYRRESNTHSDHKTSRLYTYEV